MKCNLMYHDQSMRTSFHIIQSRLKSQYKNNCKAFGPVIFLMYLVTGKTNIKSSLTVAALMCTFRMAIRQKDKKDKIGR